MKQHRVFLWNMTWQAWIQKTSERSFTTQRMGGLPRSRPPRDPMRFISTDRRFFGTPPGLAKQAWPAKERASSASSPPKFGTRAWGNHISALAYLLALYPLLYLHLTQTLDAHHPVAISIVSFGFCQHLQHPLLSRRRMLSPQNRHWPDQSLYETSKELSSILSDV